VTIPVKQYPPHPLALLVPGMVPDEYADLLASIRVNGLYDPITLFEEQVLDGIHRQRACFESGVAPRYIRFNPGPKGAEPSAFVLARNRDRRHLTACQRSEMSVNLETWVRAQLPKKTAGPDLAKVAALLGLSEVPLIQGTSARPPEIGDLCARAAGASPQSVQVYKTIMRQAPDLITKMSAGALSLNEAETQRRRRGLVGVPPAESSRGVSRTRKGHEDMAQAIALAEELTACLRTITDRRLTIHQPTLLRLDREVGSVRSALRKLAKLAAVLLPVNGLAA
jgi:hypothetical protein